MVKKFMHVQKSNSKIESTYFYVIVATFFVFNALLPQVRVGDGSEYIMAFYAIAKHGIPWINSSTLIDYSSLFNSHQIVGLVPGTQIQSTYSVLNHGSGFDMNHFWLYSGVAAIFYWLFSVIGISIGVSFAFLLLHTSLFAILLRTSQRYFGKFGILGISSLYLLSPMLWYGNKIHTEFFTFTLVALATIFVSKNEFLLAFLCLGTAGTQNISFSLIAFAVLLFQLRTFVINKQIKLKKTDVLAGLLGLLLSVIHPVYYLLRQGVIDPQLKAGGASVGLVWHNLLVWFVDPDIGLLPNWLYGIFLILSIVIGWRNHKSYNVAFHIYIVIFISISLFAQSSTTKLNSGATPGPARYGFWYIGLFSLTAIAIMRKLIENETSFTYKIVGISSLLIVGVVSVWSFTPIRHESYTKPSHVSYFIQTHFSDFYDPDPQIFRQRYSIFGDQLIPAIVVGPDCKKVLVTPVVGRGQIYSPSYCHYNDNALRNFGDEQGNLPISGKYFRLNRKEENSLTFQITNRTILFSIGSTGTQLLGDGWSQSELWGTWSDGHFESITVPCLVANQPVTSLRFKFSTYQKQRVNFKFQNQISESVFSGNSSSITFKVDAAACLRNWSSLKINTPSAISPLSLNESGDTRLLGIGAISLTLMEN